MSMHLLIRASDLNGSYIETLDVPPSALEFSRLVHVSRPVVIKGQSLVFSFYFSIDFETVKAMMYLP